MSATDLSAVPTLKIDGKLIKPKSPRMKAWRKFLEFYERDEEELKSMSLSEYTDELTELVVLSFNREEVTAEKLDEVLGVSELKPLTAGIYRWLQSIFFLGLEEIPNAEAEAEEKK